MSRYTLASPTSDSFHHESKRPTVLLLRGWVPGPVFHLKHRLQSEFDCDFVEPELLMPPFFHYQKSSSWWCIEANFLLQCCVGLGFLAGLYHVWTHYDNESTERTVYLTLLLLALAYWIRLMVAYVARAAIADGVEKCLQELRRREVVLCVGFSWGAGVLSELLATQESCLLGVDTRPAFVLMAPVSARTATAAMRPDAADRLVLQLQDGNQQEEGEIHVVHASDDPYFCPPYTQRRWNQLPGVRSTTLTDQHVFKSAASRRAIGDIVTALYQRKTGATPTISSNPGEQDERALQVV